jgi:outer membrane protein assembly factor BamB
MRRWTYSVPGDGFLGNAVVTDDGGLAFREADAGMLTVLDTSTGRVRWSRDVNDPRSAGDLPSAAPGLVLYVDAEQRLYALDSATGAVRWQAPAGNTGQVVVTGDAAAVMPDSSSGPTVTVFAYSLADGHELWHRRLADISAVFAEQDGFLLTDYRADTMTLVRASTATPVWQAEFRRIDNLGQPPTVVRPGELAVLEIDAVAFVDESSGDTRQVSASTAGGYAAAAGAGGLFVTGGTQAALLSPTGTSWTVALPQYAQLAPAALADGGITVQTEDPMCGIAD